MSSNVYFTVGPTKLYPTVFAHLKEAMDTEVTSKVHRGVWFEGMYAETLRDLRALMNIPNSHEIFFTTSGTEGMERATQNCVAKKSGHVTYGSFSRLWANIARQLGKDVEEVAITDGEVPDLSKVSFSSDVEFIALTHNETSTGGALTAESIVEFRVRHPHTLIGVDTVSSAPVLPIPWSAVDFMTIGAQKAFGIPAGLGLIIVSDRAFQKSVEVAKATSTGSYHNFENLKKFGDKNQTHETPNVLAIYLLHKVLKDMLAVGRESLTEGVARRAKMLYTFLDSQDTFKPFVKNERGQSLTTIAIEVKGGSITALEALKKKGLIVGAGYGERKENDIRVANFPAHTDEEYERLIEALSELVR